MKTKTLPKFKSDRQEAKGGTRTAISWWTAATMKRIDRSAEFVRNLEALRLEYRNKRNFMSLVEQKRKLLYLA